MNENYNSDYFKCEHIYKAIKTEDSPKNSDGIWFVMEKSKPRKIQFDLITFECEKCGRRIQHEFERK